MKVRYDEGIATHIGPEPCIVGRKASGEALAGECAGQPSSRGRIIPGLSIPKTQIREYWWCNPPRTGCDMTRPVR